MASPIPSMAMRIRCGGARSFVFERWRWRNGVGQRKMEIRERMEGSAKGSYSSVVGMKRCRFEKKSVFGVRLMDGNEDSMLLNIAVSSRQVDPVFYIRRGRSFASCGCEDWAASLSHLLDSLVSVHERTRRSM